MKKYFLCIVAFLISTNALAINLDINCNDAKSQWSKIICENEELYTKYTDIVSNDNKYYNPKESIIKFLIYNFPNEYKNLYNTLGLSKEEELVYKLMFITEKQQLDDEKSFNQDVEYLHNYLLNNVYFKEYYLELAGKDFKQCYKDKCCFIKAINNFFADIIIPCDIAMECDVLYAANIGNCATSFFIANNTCNIDKKYNVEKKVSDFVYNLTKDNEYIGYGTIRCPITVYNKRYNYDKIYAPKKLLKDIGVIEKEPLLSWAIASYPNWIKYKKAYNYGIGYEKAFDLMQKHYQEVFDLSHEDALKATINRFRINDMWYSKVDRENNLKYLILSGAPWKKIQEKIDRCLQEDTCFSITTELLAVSIHRPDILQNLIENYEEKLPINEAIDYPLKKTVLMYAAQFGFPESVKILIDNGADINMQTALSDCYTPDEECIKYGGRTALMYAVSEGNYDIAKYLIQNGADKTIKDSKGNIALDYLLNKVFINGYPKQYMFSQYTKEPTDPKTLMSPKEFEELKLLLN